MGHGFTQMNTDINSGNLSATIVLKVEWIRFLISFLDRIYRIKRIFFACGVIPQGRRPFYPVDPVNPV